MSSVGLAQLIDVWYSLRDAVYSSPVPQSYDDPYRNTFNAPKSTVSERHFEYTYITPSIVAIWIDSSSLNTRRDDSPLAAAIEKCLRSITNDRPAMLWDIGNTLSVNEGGAVSKAFRAVLSSNVIQVQWECPCDYTKAPTIGFLLSLCNTIRSWYSLNESHVSIFLCPNGLPNTGILIAALLRSLGAFSKSIDAYDYYCIVRARSKRVGDPRAGVMDAVRVSTNHDHDSNLPSDGKSSGSNVLAPSYQLLFRNIDAFFHSHLSPSLGAATHSFLANERYSFLKVITVSGLPVEEMPCVEVFDLTGVVFHSHSEENNRLMCRWSNDDGDGFFRVAKHLHGDFSVVCRFGGRLADKKDKSTLIFKYQNNASFLQCSHPTAFVRRGKSSSAISMDLGNDDIDINPRYVDSIDLDRLRVSLVIDDVRLQSPDDNRLKYSDAFTSQYMNMPGKDSLEQGLSTLSSSLSVIPSAPKIIDLKDIGKIIDADSRTYEQYAFLCLQLSDNNIDSAVDYIDKIRYTMENFWRAAFQVDVGDAVCSACFNDIPAKVSQLLSCSGCRMFFHTFCVGLRRIPFEMNTAKECHIRKCYIDKHYAAWLCNICKSSAADSQSYDGSKDSSSAVITSIQESIPQPMPMLSSISELTSKILQRRRQRHDRSSPTPTPTAAQAQAVRAVIDETAVGRTTNAAPSTSAVVYLRQSLMHNVRQDQHAIMLGLLFLSRLSVNSVENLDVHNQRNTIISVLNGSFLAAEYHSGRSRSALAIQNNSKYDLDATKMDLSSALRGIIGLPIRRGGSGGSGTSTAATEPEDDPLNGVGKARRSSRPQVFHARSASHAEFSFSVREKPPPEGGSSLPSLRSPRGGSVPRLRSGPTWQDYHTHNADALGDSYHGRPIGNIDPRVSRNGGDGPRFPELTGLGSHGQSFGSKTRPRYTNIVPEVVEKSRPTSAMMPTDSSTMRARQSTSATQSASSADIPEFAAMGRSDQKVAGEGNAPVVTVNSTQRYLKYFKMVQLGLSPQSVAAKMLSDGMVNSFEDGLKVS